MSVSVQSARDLLVTCLYDISQRNLSMAFLCGISGQHTYVPSLERVYRKTLRYALGIQKKVEWLQPVPESTPLLRGIDHAFVLGGLGVACLTPRTILGPGTMR